MSRAQRHLRGSLRLTVRGLLLCCVRCFGFGQVWSTRRDSVSGDEWRWGVADEFTAVTPPAVARLCMLTAAVTSVVCSAMLTIRAVRFSLCSSRARWSVQLVQLSSLQCVRLLYVLLSWSLCMHLAWASEAAADSDVTLGLSWAIDLASALLACGLCMYFRRAVEHRATDEPFEAAPSAASAARPTSSRDIAYAQLMPLPSDLSDERPSTVSSHSPMFDAIAVEAGRSLSDVPVGVCVSDLGRRG